MRMHSEGNLCHLSEALEPRVEPICDDKALEQSEASQAPKCFQLEDDVQCSTDAKWYKVEPHFTQQVAAANCGDRI